jgi:hypothetical protein
MRETINSYVLLVGKLEGKRPTGIPKFGSVDNIKIDIREIGLDWIGLAKDKDK